MKWVNFGGGHHITRPDYDRERLVRIIREFRARWNNVPVYLEPGEAVALGTGVLVAQVMDTLHNGMDIAILDTSATAHMPDVLEMPYRPVIIDAADPGAKQFTYRLGGMTCLAGDVIGDYSFDRRLEIGDKLVFLDMAHYTMVKTTTFNGVRLPSIATHDPATRRITVHRRFGYNDYRDRLS
jgi:carboxynorspermidine decarboxylase